jgi:hypothetical protein
MKYLIAAFLLCSSLTPISSFAQPIAVTEYSAKYKASANGISASAERSLSKLTDTLYRLNDTLEAKLAGQTLAHLEQTSEFSFKNEVLVPRQYSYVLTGISNESQAISYNWDALIALSSEDDESWQLPLSLGVSDQLGYQFALRQALTKNTALGLEFAFDVIDADKIETHRYKVTGNEVLSTALGNLNTVKLERIREGSDNRMTEIWLATDWDFLLTRIEQASNSGLRITLDLESADLGGKAVIALPP